MGNVCGKRGEEEEVPTVLVNFGFEGQPPSTEPAGDTQNDKTFADFSAGAADEAASAAVKAAGGGVPMRQPHDSEEVVVRRLARGAIRLQGSSNSMLGKGAFGSVIKAVCDESATGGVPGYLVAVK